MKKLLALAPLFFAALLTHAQTATLPAGSGTAGDPYRIATLNNLYWITAPGTVDGLTETQRLTKYYKQTANIDASTTASWESGAGWRPIGNSIGAATRFGGNYHGQGYKITGLTINRPAQSTIGFFGTLTTNAVVSYVSLENVNFSGLNQVGGLVGYIEAAATITNCYTTGTLQTAVGNNRCGGIAGIVTGATTITSCYSTCSVNTDMDAGGLLGEMRTGGTVNRCYATGTVFSANGYAGGLIGYSEGTVQNSYARGNITCTAAYLVGGLIGYSSGGSVTNCFSTGSVPATGSWRGGLTGYCSGTTTASFFDTQTSGIATSHTGTPKTTAQMTDPATFSAWDFSTIWHMTLENDGYPHLEWTNYVVLPVVLKDFRVVANGNTVSCLWETQQEQLSSHFEIQEQQPGLPWKTLSVQAAAGQSSRIQQYKYEYKEPVPGYHLYRLRSVDLDNLSAFSTVIGLYIPTGKESGLSLVNPVKGNWIQLNLPEPGKLMVYDLNGKCLLLFYGNKGVNRFPCSQLPAGTYILKAGDTVIKFMKE